MLLYCGIDEAGYGPMFGPLLVARTVFALPAGLRDADPPDLWDLLSDAVCRTLSERRGRTQRIAVNDSKKLHNSQSKAGIKHLEVGAMAFAALAGHRPVMEDRWLDCLGESAHRDLRALPWYDATDDRPWQPLPRRNTPGEVAIARSILERTASQCGLRMLDIGAAVVFEDRFNRMVNATRSKAATSFTFVAQHLDHIRKRFGRDNPTVIVDRQSGRSHHRQVLAMSCPEAFIQIIEESDTRSAYRLADAPDSRDGMTVSFEVDSEQRHLPVAVASMISKYTRELMMARFKRWFADNLPDIKPTAGYGTDAKRFWTEVEPRLASLAIRPEALRRVS